MGENKMRKIVRWFNCRFRGIHRINIVSGECSVCKEIIIERSGKFD